MQTEKQRINRRAFFQMAGASACATLVQGCNSRTAKRPNTRPTPEFSEVSADRLPPSSQPYIDVVVRPVVMPIKQISDSTCWAAAWTMMLSWKEGKRLSIEDAVAHLGPEWIARYEKNEGLIAQTFTEKGFLSASGLRQAPPANSLS